MAKNHLTVDRETGQPPIGKETFYFYARFILFVSFIFRFLIFLFILFLKSKLFIPQILNEQNFSYRRGDRNIISVYNFR